LPSASEPIHHNVDVRTLLDADFGRIWHDCAYGPFPETVLDFYMPDRPIALPVPLFIVIHGGGFHQGDKANPIEAVTARRLCRSGYAVASINYRLVKNYDEAVFPNPDAADTWPACLIDAQRAVCWLRGVGPRWGNIDQDKFIGWGQSAGAALALELASRDDLIPAPGLWQPGRSPKIAAAICHSTPADFAAALDGSPPSERHYAEIKAVINETDLASFQNASPLNWISGNTGPVAFTQGSEDTEIPPYQADRLQAALAAHGVPYHRQDYTGGHVFAGLTRPEIRALCLAAEQWVLETLG
jgi:acetyl esterase/lipase